MARKSTNLLADKLVAIHNGLIDQLPISLNFSIGNEVTDPASIHFSFREAMDALDISLKEDVQPVVTFFQSKGLNKLIDYVPKEDIEHFCLVEVCEWWSGMLLEGGSLREDNDKKIIWGLLFSFHQY